MSANASETILVLNGGSSSLKFAVWITGPSKLRSSIKGEVGQIGSAKATLRYRIGDDAEQKKSCSAGTLEEALPPVLDLLERSAVRPDAVGHRLVHGGPRHLEPSKIDDALIDSLRSAIPFAPLHLPGEIALIEAVRKRHPLLPQVACFDTSFHTGMPDIAKRLALPAFLWDRGVRRYGFHGLSYESIVETLGPLLGARTIIAHLGNGASMVALRDGQPLDTTMGLTPCGGLVMGTRSGDLDPGVAVYLARSCGLDASAIEELVDWQSGLLALSETSSDMQTLLVARDSDPRAKFAVAFFCYSVRKWIGALAAVLGGLDTLVFTGGIGEHAAPVREEICRELGWLGLQVDTARNDQSEAIVSTAGSRCAIRVVPTAEERIVASHTARLVFEATE
jgi:acetate kinase